ncbi:DNA-binding transcriptional regulator, AcrR family [Mucilaginibacter gossypiicola]|uniref:DNA-binding transcriptional regulator, AcrR family n=1 Tax=Mucilaginibacter gossypiicola TaxID=551995 RepID=A0A1H8LVL9_9SPHI|nr:TetR/AcrR family transcriptional regulator [Mucilaginibacter gossypiicola]SEO09139.1 DNA-binding transcriptional regulator, AcrR family [Mucilaginibacter gossypiicola]
MAKQYLGKEQSMCKLVAAVGIVIRAKGYKGLTGTNIAKAAGLSKRLIYIYFESVEDLIETYIRQKDYYAGASSNFPHLQSSKQNKTYPILIDLLTNQLEQFYKDDELQKIVLWQISERSKVMFDVCEEREKLGSKFFRLADLEFKGTSVDLRAVTGLLVAGIYHMVLHAKSTDSLFCEIDLNTPEGLERIKKAIIDILGNTYNKAISERKTNSIN